MSTIAVDIVTPNGKVFEGDADMVIARATSGELGVLPGHMPLVAPLEIGPLRLKRAEGTKHVAVSGGFIEIRPEKVTILAEAAELPEHIDVERAERARQRAEKRLGELSREDEEYQLVRAALNRAINRIDVAKK